MKYRRGVENGKEYKCYVHKTPTNNLDTQQICAPDVRLVDPHSIGDGGAHDAHFPSLPSPLYALPLRHALSRVVIVGRNLLTPEKVAQRRGFLGEREACAPVGGTTVCIHNTKIAREPRQYSCEPTV